MINKTFKITVIANDDLLNGPSLAQFRFAKSLASLGYAVELILANKFNKYDLSRFKHKNINIINLNKKRTFFLIFPLIKYLLKNKPDIIFSAGDHLNLILIISILLSFSKTKISLSSRVTPLDTYRNKSKIDFDSDTHSKSKIMFYLFKLLSWRANVLTCVSEEMVKQYQEVFGSTKHVCVYNIIKDKDSISLQDEILDDPWINNNDSFPFIIAAGQLAPWKGFEDLINAYSLIKDKIKHKLIILGNGNDRDKLENLIIKKNLKEHVYMPGYVLNPLKYFKKSDIFVLSSISEGMPNVLIEAMMCGCTPVATDCKTGPKEILKNNEFGYLSPVKDHIALSENILLAVKNPISKEKLDIVIKKFGAESIIKKHFDLLKIE